MKIALLYPMWTEAYGSIAHFAKQAGKWPPLNLAYLASAAEALGHEVMIIDGEAEELPIPAMVDMVTAFAPDVVGITATTPFYHIAVELGHALKNSIPTATLCIGGPHVSVLGEPVFHDCFDIAFIREADQSWPAYLRARTAGDPIGQVRGILHRENGRVVFTGPTDAIANIDEIPLPSRKLLKHDLYNLGTIHGMKRFTTIMTARGCPFECIFCSTKTFGKDTRRRDPDLVIKEIKDCIENYGTEHFMFLDDTLTMNRQHFATICQKIIQAGLSITLEGSTRANLVDEELVALMAKAGLIRLSFGLETVDESMRKTMKKMVPLEAYIKSNQITNKYGIETLNSCMIGLPGETRESIRKTLAFLRKSPEIKQANISIAVPYPGTELYDMAKNELNGLKLETEDFSQYRRYNAAVMTVGDLSPADLIAAQNEAFASIYLAPWRWEPMIAKSGLTGALLTMKRLADCLKKGSTHYLTDRQLKVAEDVDLRPV